MGYSLFTAAEEGNIERVTVLLREGAYINWSTSDGATSLMVACQNANTGVVDVLLNADADIEARLANGASALILAVQNKRLKVVDQLIKAGADVNAPEFVVGVTPLIMSAAKGYAQIARMLLQSNADIHKTDDNGRSPLDWARHAKHPAVVTLLENFPVAL